MHSRRFLSYSKKRKISQSDHSLSLVIIRYYSLSFVVTRCLSLYHSLSLVIIHCYSLSFVVTRCLSLYHSLSLVIIRCHSLSFVVICCHSLSLVVHWLSLAVSRCHSLYHSLSLDVSLVYLFMNDHSCHEQTIKTKQTCHFNLYQKN